MRNTVLLVALFLVFGYVITVQAQVPEHPERYSLHEVVAGDTLWSISEKYLPDTDPRLGVEWISEANGLETAIIHPSDILNVPDPNGPLLEPLGPWYSSPEAAQAAEREFQRLLRESRPQPAARGAARTMTVEATAYCSCVACTGKEPSHPAYGITASGERVRPGVVAVDPDIIPLGTKMWVEGYGEADALDTGGAIQGGRIDVYFPDHRQAVEWGRKSVEVRVIK